MLVEPEKNLFRTVRSSRRGRAIVIVCLLSLALNLLSLSLVSQVGMLLLGLLIVSVAAYFSPKDWRPAFKFHFLIFLALAIGFLATVSWSKESDRAQAFSLLFRVANGSVWIAAITLSLSWNDLKQAFQWLKIPAWLVSYLEESLTSALLLLRGMSESHESVLLRFGRSHFSNVPWVLATGLDQGFTRIRASQDARSLRIAAFAKPTFTGEASSRAPGELTESVPSLEARDLCVIDKDSGYQILQNLSFRIESSEWVGIFGASGSGKTSLLRALSGLTPATSGTVSVFGRERLGRIPHSEIAFVFQNPQNSVLASTPWDDACLGPSSRNLSMNEIEERVRGLFESFSMQEIMHRPVSHLSFGELKQLSLISALASKPKILFCDEPTSGLDAITASHLIRVLSRISDEEKISVLWASHDLHLLPKRIRRGIVLAKGKIIDEIDLGLSEIDENFWSQTHLWPGRHEMHRVTFPKAAV